MLSKIAWIRSAGFWGINIEGEACKSSIRVFSWLLQTIEYSLFSSYVWQTSFSYKIWSLQESVTNLISSYLGHLLDERKYDLVPQYTCRVPSQSRRQICCEMLANLTREDDSETQMNIFNSLSACFSDWYQQERGDIEDDELAQIAEMVRPSLSDFTTIKKFIEW